MSLAATLLFASLVPLAARAAAPTTWEARGVGGGGALFSPSFNPANPDELYVACDMSQLFHSSDSGLAWDTLDFHQVQGGHAARVAFTSDPLTRYTIDHTSLGGNDWQRPVKSTDGGASWTVLPGDPTGGYAYGIWVDYDNPSRVLVNDWNKLYFSSDGGTSFAARYTAKDNGSGAAVGGVFFDGQNIYVGSNDGLLASANGGGSFALVALGGIPAGEFIVSFAGARQNSTTRFYAVTSTSVWNGIEAWEHWGYAGVYSLDLGQANWTKRVGGIAAGVHAWFVGLSRGDIATAYLGATDSSISYPMVLKTTSGGQLWTSVLGCTGNSNIATGWSGYQGDRDWWYGEVPLGFAVSPLDANRVAFSDYGFIHQTSDGGASWRQTYAAPADQHPAGLATPRGASYHSVGLENTTSWCVAWADATNLFACNSDIRGMRSTDAGQSWGFNYSGHTENSMYRVVRGGDGTLYGGTSSGHDIYQSTNLSDANLDGKSGRLIYSLDQGQTWQLLHDFGHSVVWVATDPGNPNRLYAAVVHSTQGGIYVTSDVQNGAASQWVKLAKPPRSEGHPLSLTVLADGALVASYSGRRDGGGAFTASSGVFLSTDSGQSWADRSDPGMLYWTWDVVVDPHNANQNTWYAGVYSGWGGAPNDKGGLYRTSNRGQSWTKLVSVEGVTSLSISPVNPDEAYLTTEVQGLWYTDNLNAPSITWAETSYPFRQPERVYYNPYDPAEVWVTSFGGGLRVGTSGPPGPSCWALTTGVSPSGAGSVGVSPAADCAGKWSDGTQVTLTASPAAGYAFGGWSGGASGAQNPVIVAMGAAKSVTASFTLVVPSVPAPPALVSPANGAASPNRTPLLDWSDSAGATSYKVQVKRGSSGGGIVAKPVVSASQYPTPTLARNTSYFWHVRACNAKGCSAWTPYRSFKVTK